MERFMLPCLNKMMFGIDCLGCGFQRSVLLLLKGEFHAAFTLYPAVYTILLFLVFLLLNKFWKTKHHLKIKYGFIFINAIIVIGSYSYKMQHLFN